MLNIYLRGFQLAWKYWFCGKWVEDLYNLWRFSFPLNFYTDFVMVLEREGYGKIVKK